ncbi:MAG TPA: phosphoribosylglycinamide formyltransferase [Bacteroidota bacterium]|nr:phosphoribosylglycinamide formyltransferase [Bacteroidota bacterium]
MNIAIFASGRGSNFEALYRALSEQRIDARIVCVISNNSDSGALALARSFQIPAFHLSSRQFADERAFVARQLELLASFDVGLIVLAGYMKKIDAAVIDRYRNRILNIHPALLPKFGGKGMYGHFVHEAVISAGETESGATVHLVTDEYDRGPIVVQRRVQIDTNDTPDSLAHKVLAVEHTLLAEAVALFASNNVSVDNHRVVIRRNSPT